MSLLLFFPKRWQLIWMSGFVDGIDLSHLVKDVRAIADSGSVRNGDSGRLR
jgi:hypothetical protein